MAMRQRFVPPFWPNSALYLCRFLGNPRYALERWRETKGGTWFRLTETFYGRGVNKWPSFLRRWVTRLYHWLDYRRSVGRYW
jgi:hypothetical protein